VVPVKLQEDYLHSTSVYFNTDMINKAMQETKKHCEQSTQYVLPTIDMMISQSLAELTNVE
jgi:hypothetical protein